jgi:hypothetical protein
MWAKGNSILFPFLGFLNSEILRDGENKTKQTPLDSTR